MKCRLINSVYKNTEPSSCSPHPRHARPELPKLCDSACHKTLCRLPLVPSQLRGQLTVPGCDTAGDLKVDPWRSGCTVGTTAAR